MRTSRFVPRFAALALALGVSGFTLPALAAVPVQFSAAAGEVKDIVVASATLGYAGTLGGGLWKTTDAGNTWTKTSLSAKTVHKISVNPASGGARLYAATETGLYRSVDAGATWARLTQDATRAVAVMPTSPGAGPDTLLIGVYGAGVYKSTNNGDTITRASSGLNATDFTGIAWAPGSSTTAYVSINCNYDDLRLDPGFFEGPWGGVFTTSNAGATWTDITGNLPSGGGSPRPCPSSVTVVSSGAIVGLKQPDDGGGSYVHAGGGNWTASNSQGYGITFVAPDFTNANGVWRGTIPYGIQRSTTGNSGFADVANAGTDPDFASRGASAASFTNSTFVAGIAGIGLFRTTTGNSPWNLPATPIRADKVNDLANHGGTAPNTYYMALEWGSVMKSTNGGASWSLFVNGISTIPQYLRNGKIVGAHPNNTAVAGVGLRGQGLFQLTADGLGWQAYPGGGNNGVDNRPQSLVITPGGKVYYSLFDGGAATPGGLFVATATGNTLGGLVSTGVPFSPAAPSSVAPGSYRVRLGFAAPESRAYLLMYDSHPFRTDNGGANWARVNTTGLGAGFQNHAFMDVAERTGGNVAIASTNKGIYRSIDGGANWAFLATTGLPETQLNSIVYFGSAFFGATFGGKLYCSLDDGASWLAVSGGDLGAAVKDMKVMNGSIHVLTDGAGIFKKDNVCP